MDTDERHIERAKPMLIGTRHINQTACTMHQTTYNTITVEIEGMGAQEFIGTCDNAHIDEVWAAVTVALAA
jgi:hypothetical protein